MVNLHCQLDWIEMTAKTTLGMSFPEGFNKRGDLLYIEAENKQTRAPGEQGKGKERTK